LCERNLIAKVGDTILYTTGWSVTPGITGIF